MITKKGIILFTLVFSVLSIDANAQRPRTTRGAQPANRWYIGYPNSSDIVARLSGETFLIISGSGKMKNFQAGDNDHLPNNYVVKVEIKEGVTSIGNRAFANSYQLQSVAIPNSVTHIGEYAFSGIARTFTAIVIPDGVTSIGRGAFISTYLETVTIGENVTDIGNEAFYNSIHIRSVINRSPAPQVINRDYTFSDVRNAKLYVPKEAIDKYRNSSWNIFGEILPIEE